MKFEFEIEGNKREINIEKLEKNGYDYEVFKDGKKRKFTLKKVWSRNYIIIDENNKVFDVFVDKAVDERCLFFKGHGYKTKSIDKKRRGGGFEVEGTALIKSPLPGIIKRVEKEVGDEVSAGEGILFLEAMKMENEIKSPKSGIIKKIYIQEADAVSAGDKLFIVE